MVQFENPWKVVKSGQKIMLKLPQEELDKLGPIYFLDLPDVGAQLQAGMPCISIEAAKWIGTSKAPVDGQVIAVNQAVAGLNSQDLTSQDWILELVTH
ncbi:glycine cleavage system protein H [Limosilactobacillus caecicola]|uniref:hypothetical protein n=1 Tax=Limosilactobacillus caecicola TaxID=2941332 RepID=UPI00203F57A4|nr:hypothetical protein [Limosilactobacillus caecicola]